MKKQAFVVATLTAALFLAACEGDDGINGVDGADGADGANGADGADGFNSLVAVRDIPKGDEVCLGGGKAVDSGLDLNRNDILDDDEVTATEILECAATPTLRALHASPDAPAVNIWVNEEPALVGVDYTVGSGFLPVVEEVLVQVEANIPFVDNIEDRIVIEETLPLDYSTETTIIAIDTVAPNEIEGSIRAWAITNPSDELITPGNFRAQLVHAAPSAPAVDVYLTALDAALETPVTGVDTPLVFEGDTPRLEAPAGAYQVRITLAGEPEEVVFDSGAEIPLPDGADLMIVAVDNTGPGASPVKLVVLDGAGSSTLIDANTTASVVAVHLSPDAPAVDLLADVTGTPEIETIPLVRNVSFGAFCDIGSVPAPGNYTISVALNENNDVVAYTFPALQFEQGDEALAIVSGFAGAGLDPAITDITLRPSPKRTRRSPTCHLAPAPGSSSSTRASSTTST